MQTGILVTNGGPHPADKWAAQTAAQIIQIGADASGEQAIAARKFELVILDILEDHHGKVQTHERGKITEHGTARFAHPLDSAEHVDAPFQAIVAASKGTLFESHFAKPEVQAHIRNVLASHFATSMDIERSWFADDGSAADAHRAKHLPNAKRDPNCPHLAKYRQDRAPLPAGVVSAAANR